MCDRQAQPRAHHLSWLPREIPWTLTAAKFGADCFAHLLPRPAVHTQTTWNGCGKVVGTENLPTYPICTQGDPRTPFATLSVSTCGYANNNSIAIAIISVRPSHIGLKPRACWHHVPRTRIENVAHPLCGPGARGARRAAIMIPLADRVGDVIGQIGRAFTGAPMTESLAAGG